MYKNYEKYLNNRNSYVKKCTLNYICRDIIKYKIKLQFYSEI